jgi:CRISPR/Cas system-associated endoribonuclease Cas2
MRGEITLKILEFIENLAVGTADLLDAILSAGYGASYSKIQYELSKRQRERYNKEIKREIRRRRRQKYHKIIYKLKRDGLIKEKFGNNKKFLIITKKGRDKLSSLKAKNNRKLPETYYQKEKGDKFVIVIFDIPEAEKRKRAWIRSALRNLELKMAQKSVWIGKVKIPKQFIDDLYKLKLADFVEIFEISKTGSFVNFLLNCNFLEYKTSFFLRYPDYDTTFYGDFIRARVSQ